MSEPLTRREFVKGGALTVVGALLSGCLPAPKEKEGQVQLQATQWYLESELTDEELRTSLARAKWRGLREGLKEFDWIESSTLEEGEASLHRLSDFGEVLVERKESGLEVVVRRICPGGERGEVARASVERGGVKAVAEVNLVESERLQLEDLPKDDFLYVFINIGKLSQGHSGDYFIIRANRQEAGFNYFSKASSEN